MIGAGLIARNAVKRGLNVRPWVKTSLAPGSQVVTDYLAKPASTRRSTSWAFRSWVTAAQPASAIPGAARSDPNAITENDLVTAAVLSGNRNFEGRVHPQVRRELSRLADAGVAYALAARSTSI